MAVFVLVHGGFHGGWCYGRVARQLRALGHDVHTPTLSGLGERAHLAALAINLSTHVQDVVSLILNEDLRDIVLCGHSYAGMVITGVASEIGERIKALFYLDACVPEDGESLVDIIGPERTLALLSSAGENGITAPPVRAEVFRVDPLNVGWVDQLCTPHPIACFIQKLRLTGKEKSVHRRTFVLAKRYQSVNHATYEKVRHLVGWKTVELDCGHEVMVDRPQVLTSLLLEEV